MQNTNFKTAIPEFVKSYCQQNNLSISHNLFRRTDRLSDPKTPSEAIELVYSSKTPTNLENSYIFFLSRIISDTSVAFMLELQQFTFPLFMKISYELFKFYGKTELMQFVNKFRYEQPSECQEIIDKLYECYYLEQFPAEDYEISISREAYTHAIVRLDKLTKTTKYAALPVLFNTCAKLKIVDTVVHEYIFSNDTKAIYKPNALPLLNKEKKQLIPFSARYKLETPIIEPTVQVEDDISYINQSFPDVANLEVYNHDNMINIIRYSPNARLIAAVRGNNVYISALDGITKFDGKVTERLVSHRGTILAVAFSNDSRFLATSGVDGVVKISHLEAFIPFSMMDSFSLPIFSLVFDRTGTFLAGSCSYGCIYVWNVSTCKICRYLQGHSMPPTSLIFSKDSKSLISASPDRTIRVWNLEKEPNEKDFCIAVIRIHSAPVAIDIDHHNKFLAIGMEDGSVALWNMTKGERIWEVNDAKSLITDVKFTLDRSLVLASTADGYVYMWKRDKEGAMVLKIDAIPSTVDTILITERNAVLTAGRSRRGDQVM